MGAQAIPAQALNTGSRFLRISQQLASLKVLLMACFRALLGALSPFSIHQTQMACGKGVPLCGTLTLESGLGSGAYHHKTAHVHGLWPATACGASMLMGTSECIAPKKPKGPSKIYSCYADKEDSYKNIIFFEAHEWKVHGHCAGVVDVDDYFEQVCGLADAPLAVLRKAKKAGADFHGMQKVLKDNG